MNCKCCPAHAHKKKFVAWQQCMTMCSTSSSTLGIIIFFNVFANFIGLHSSSLPQKSSICIQLTDCFSLSGFCSKDIWCDPHWPGRLCQVQRRCPHKGPRAVLCIPASCWLPVSGDGLHHGAACLCQVVWSNQRKQRHSLVCKLDLHIGPKTTPSCMNPSLHTLQTLSIPYFTVFMVSHLMSSIHPSFPLSYVSFRTPSLPKNINYTLLGFLPIVLVYFLTFSSLAFRSE